MECTGETLHQSLRSALEHGGLQDWDAFVRGAHPVITSFAVRTLARWGPVRPDQVDDLVQEVFLKLCSNDYHHLRSFRSQSPGALMAYLRAVTSALGIDAERLRRTQKRGSGKVSAELDEASAALATTQSIDEAERQMLYGQINRCLNAHPAREKQIFWLYYRHGLTSQAISSIRMMQLSTSGVESLVRRLTHAVRKCLNAVANPKISTSSKGSFA